MQIADYESTAFAGKNPVGAVRENKDRLKTLLEREGHLRTFWFVYTETEDGEHYSPRHRHNFDQIRIGLAGVSHYGKHVLRERMIGYFPEGTFYGPHTLHELPSRLATLQVDGSSRAGYLPYRFIEAATHEMKTVGAFRKGVYYPNEGKAMEAFQAAWERATGRPADFPKPRFDEPILMHLDAFPWSPAHAGVARKEVGAFGVDAPSIAMTHLDRGAAHAFAATDRTVIHFLLDGEGTTRGRNLSRYSAFALEPGETLELRGESAATEIIEIVLPNLAPTNPAHTNETTGKALVTT